jgi:antitoxin component of MazEF toxin-antitoxin module
MGRGRSEPSESHQTVMLLGIWASSRNETRLTKQFRATLEGAESSTATFVRIPASVMREFGGRIRVPVRITVEGVEHRTTICDMGMGPMVGIPAAIRKAAGIERDDRITVSLKVDEEERTVSVPQDLTRRLNSAQRRVFDKMAYTHRKEYVQWVEAAKKPETRARRIEQVRAKMDERLAGGRCP